MSHWAYNKYCECTKLFEIHNLGLELLNWKFQIGLSKIVIIVEKTYDVQIWMKSNGQHELYEC